MNVSRPYVCYIFQKMLTFSIFLVAFLFVGSEGNATSRRKLSKRDLYAVSHASNNFAVNLHKSLSKESEGNIFFSPFSASSALSMLYFGARGETARELRKVLGYGKMNDSTVFSSFNYYLTEVIEKINPKIYAVNSVSALVVDKSFPLLQQYKKDVAEIFHAYVQDANIAEESAAVVDRINTWAKIKTRGAISNLAESLDPETKLYLASAAYFKGAWKIQFDPEDTKYHPFYNGGKRTNTSEVLMMHSYAMLRYYEGVEDTFTAVELFYEGNNMSMVIYLPDQYEGLGDIEEDMTASMMTFVRQQMYFMKVHLTMPKFKLEYEASLCRSLQDLGLKKIFRWTDDLAGMVADGASLTLSDVWHKAVVEVHEKGSVAAAVTRAVMTKSMPLRIPDPEFTVNRPFLFAIFDTRSGMILFMGRVTHF